MLQKHLFIFAVLGMWCSPSRRYAVFKTKFFLHLSWL